MGSEEGSISDNAWIKAKPRSVDISDGERGSISRAGVAFLRGVERSSWSIEEVIAGSLVVGDEGREGPAFGAVRMLGSEAKALTGAGGAKLSSFVFEPDSQRLEHCQVQTGIMMPLGFTH